MIKDLEGLENRYEKGIVGSEIATHEEDFEGRLLTYEEKVSAYGLSDAIPFIKNPDDVWRYGEKMINEQLGTGGPDEVRKLMKKNIPSTEIMMEQLTKYMGSFPQSNYVLTSNKYGLSCVTCCEIKSDKISLLLKYMPEDDTACALQRWNIISHEMGRLRHFYLMQSNPELSIEQRTFLSYFDSTYTAIAKIHQMACAQFLKARGNNVLGARIPIEISNAGFFGIISDIEKQSQYKDNGQLKLDENIFKEKMLKRLGSSWDDVISNYTEYLKQNPGIFLRLTPELIVAKNMINLQKDSGLSDLDQAERLYNIFNELAYMGNIPFREFHKKLENSFSK